MNRSLAAVAAILALAGCGEETTEPKTADEIISEASKLEKPRPGQYQTNVKMLEFSVPGLPDAQAEQLKGMMGNASAQASSYCLTEQDAAKGFEEPIRQMTEGTGQMKCEFKDFDVNGGKIAAALTCSGRQGLTADIALDGTASADESSMQMEMSQKSAMLPGGELKMVIQMNSKRIGDCA